MHRMGGGKENLCVGPEGGSKGHSGILGSRVIWVFDSGSQCQATPALSGADSFSSSLHKTPLARL